MTDLGDFTVKSPSSEPGGRRDRPVGLIGAIVAIGLLCLVVAVYWYMGRDREEPQPAAPSSTEATPPQPVDSPEPAVPEPEPLPALDDSDEFIRNLVAALSSHPGFVAWLSSDDLIRRFVVVVDNVANGNNPAQHLEFMRPDLRFGVTGDEPNLRIDSRSYRRYDAHAQIVASLDVAGVSELYERLEPLMDDAYAELGSSDTRFRETLGRAISHLLDVPLVDGTPAVEAGAAFYEYTDDDLDRLTPAQKQFIGMGSENVRVVQRTLREIANTIGLRLPS